MKKISMYLLLVLSMVILMAIPAFASAYADYAETGSTFATMLIPEVDQAVVDGDSVWVELVLFCEYEGEEVEQFGFYKFYDTIKYNKNRFEFVKDSEWIEDGFTFEVIEEGEILVTGENVTGIENGVAVCYFELQAIDTGSASLKQEDVEIRRTSSSTSKYTVTKETGTLKGVTSLSDEDVEYTVTTDYDSTRGTIYLSTKSAVPGEEVWFRVGPKSGYDVEDIVVYYEDVGGVHEVRCRADIDDYGHMYYYFTMPEAGVIVNVDFISNIIEPTTGNDIKLFFDADYGFVYLNTYSAEEGTRINITIDPYDDFYGFTIDIEDADGNTYTPQLTTPQTYCFEMPNSDVEVNVEFTGTLVSSGATYSIIDNTDKEYGYAIMPSKAAEGMKVKVLAFPKDGYIVDRVNVYGFDSDINYSVTKHTNYYMFTMPDETVIVEVVFINEDSIGNEYTAFTDCEDNGVEVIKKGTALVDGRLDDAYKNSLILGDLGRAPNAYGTEWSGTAEADIYFLYDSVSLYICAVVEDDDVLTKGEAYATGNNPYANDCIDFRLSLDGSATETIKVAVDAYGYACYGLAAHYDRFDYSTISYATTYTDTSYIVEVRIPCTKSNLNMIEAGKLGFTYQLNDINCDGRHQNHTTSFNGEAVKMPVFYELCQDGENEITTDYDSDYGTVYLGTKSEKPGEEVWFRVVPKIGYECEEIIVYYYDDGNPCEIIYKSSIDDNGYKYYYFNMPETAVIINVDFTTISFEPATERDIKLFYDADYGFVYLNTYSAEEDTRIKIYVEKFDSSYDFTIDVEDEDGNTYTAKQNATKKYYYFDMPDKDVEINVEFTGTLASDGTTYSIVDNTDEECGYAIMPSKAAKGTEVKVMAFPEEGYVVDRVKVTGFDSDRKYTVLDYTDYYQFTMPDEKVIVEVAFIDEDDLDIEYKLLTDDIDYEHGTVTFSATTAQYDEKVKIWVNPYSGYRIDTIEIAEDKTGDTVELYGDEDTEYYYFYMPRDNVYVYVDFEKTSSSSATTYDVSLSYNKDQGTVELSRSRSAKGKTVSIFPEPEEGYVVDDVKVTKSTSSSTTVKVYDDEDERDETFYYFTMPAYPVKVTVTFKLEKGSITSSGVPGDATGDGQVNPLDLIYFMRYLAKWSGYDEEKVDVNNLDLNLDGQVNPLDSVILTRHLAQWDGYETLPGKDKKPWEYTYKEYLAMTEEEQTEHMSKFESFSDFLEWYYAARTKYEKAPEDYTYEEYLQMTEEERAEHLSKFDSQSDFLEWYYTARTKYEEELKNSN